MLRSWQVRPALSFAPNLSRILSAETTLSAEGTDHQWDTYCDKTSWKVHCCDEREAFDRSGIPLALFGNLGKTVALLVSVVSDLSEEFKTALHCGSSSQHNFVVPNLHNVGKLPDALGPE